MAPTDRWAARVAHAVAAVAAGAYVAYAAYMLHVHHVRRLPALVADEEEDGAAWAVVVPFKDRFEHLEGFVAFYREVWRADCVFFLVGHTADDRLDEVRRRVHAVAGGAEEREERPLGDVVPGLLEDGVVSLQRETAGELAVHYISYRTSRHTKHDAEWRPLLARLNKACHEALPARYGRVLCVDSDEYAWPADVGAAKARDELLLHFLEHVPPPAARRFDLGADMRWCLQPWYYAPHRIGAVHRTWQMDRRLTHFCKRFHFSRRRFGERRSGWEHECIARGGDSAGPPGTTCGLVDAAMGDEGRLREALGEHGACYHLAVLDEPFWRAHKIESGYADCNHNVCESFDAAYADTKTFPTLVDNALRPYLQPPGGARRFVRGWEPSWLQAEAALLAVYALSTAGTLYSVLNEAPGMGSVRDPKTGLERPVAFLPNRINGQYIIEGLVAAAAFLGGAAGVVLLRAAAVPTKAPGADPPARRVLLGSGAGLFAGAYLLCGLFIRIKVPQYGR